MSYAALVLIPADCADDVSVEAAAASLSSRLPSMHVQAEGDSVRCTQDGFTLTATLASAANVAAESEAIVKRYGSAREDAERLSKADRRFEVTSTDDPEMLYFNDYIFLVETLTAYDGAQAIDPTTGDFL